MRSGSFHLSSRRLHCSHCFSLLTSSPPSIRAPSQHTPQHHAPSSANGSPVEHSEEGSLVATVAKKRGGRKGLGGDGDGGGGDLGVGFDINVGDGRFISLSDPSPINHLEDDMKDAAVSQLKILQDQMASLMAQLGN